MDQELEGNFDSSFLLACFGLRTQQTKIMDYVMFFTKPPNKRS